MMLTDYYKFEHLQDCKSSLKVDCTASSKSYERLEGLRNKKKELFIYVGKNTHSKPGKNGEADLAITKTNHLSSIYVPRPTRKPRLGFGDFFATPDALIFITSGEIVNGYPKPGFTLEVFVARGQSANSKALYRAVADGELDGEINELRGRAIAEVMPVELTLF